MSNTRPARRLLTYQWADAYESMIALPPPGHLKRGIFRYSPSHFRPSIPGPLLGSLAVLPTEIILIILRHLDVQTMARFEALNTRARCLINAIAEYQLLTIHAPNVLRALICTSLMTEFSVMQLFHAACHDRCVVCNDYGSFVFLPKLWRCCFTCSQNAPQLRVISAAAARACFGLRESAVRKLAVMWTLPGCYALEQKARARRIRVISAYDARLLAISIYGSEEKMAAAVDDERARNAMSGDPRKARKPRTSMDNLMDHNDPLRGVAFTPFPFLNMRTRTLEIGFWCRGCEEAWLRWSRDLGKGNASFQDVDTFMKKRDRAFSIEEFAHHSQSCVHTKRLWDQYLWGQPAAD
ncbi:MAG: hypothetical protein M1817_001416 [Caeruleum heppii]|nr:MAG: hypothetical protein M1817_001416 [Caeruleum heppii]